MKPSKPKFVYRSAEIFGKEYSYFLSRLKDRYRNAQIKTAVRINTEMLKFYWQLGHDILLLKADDKWGSGFFETLSLDLKAEFPDQSGFSVTNLKYAKRWYSFYCQIHTNRQQAVDDLYMPDSFGHVPWGHHILIITRAQSLSEALFYINQTIECNWSRRDLEAAISDNLYNLKGNAVTNFDSYLPPPQRGLAKAILKSPYNFTFLGLASNHTEKQLEDALAQNISRFLLELGKGFAYIGRQVELRMPGGQSFYPDMIFYHTRLKCYIVVELKVKPFIPDYAGKLNFYVSAVDELMKQHDDNPSIGLLICKSKDDTVVEWSFRGMEHPLGVAQYRIAHDINKHVTDMLPSESDIQHMLICCDEEEDDRSATDE